MENVIFYQDKKLQVRGGQWADEMNSCFYDVIDEIKSYLICVDTDGEMFALYCPDADSEGRYITKHLIFW